MAARGFFAPRGYSVDNEAPENVEGNGVDSNKALVKQCAREAGFDLVGVSSAAPFAREQAVVLERLTDRLMGQLPWYTEARVRRGCNPQALLPGARSIISVACSYYTAASPLTPLHIVEKGTPSPLADEAERAFGHREEL